MPHTVENKDVNMFMAPGSTHTKNIRYHKLLAIRWIMFKVVILAERKKKCLKSLEKGEDVNISCESNNLEWHCRSLKF